MNPFKIIGWVGLAIAVIGAFVDGGIPYGGLLLLLLGLAGGVAIAAEDHDRGTSPQRARSGDELVLRDGGNPVRLRALFEL